MLTEPEIVERDDIAYAFIPATLALDAIGPAVGPALERLESQLAAIGNGPTGPGFLNHRRIDMERTLDVEFGVPVARVGENGDGIRYSILPAGRYARLVWTGPFEGLLDANGALIDWGRGNGIQWDSRLAEDGEHFACRLETYIIGPMEEPDPTKWTTEVAIKLR